MSPKPLALVEANGDDLLKSFRLRCTLSAFLVAAGGATAGPRGATFGCVERIAFPRGSRVDRISEGTGGVLLSMSIALPLLERSLLVLLLAEGDCKPSSFESLEAAETDADIAKFGRLEAADILRGVLLTVFDRALIGEARPRGSAPRFGDGLKGFEELLLNSFCQTSCENCDVDVSAPLSFVGDKGLGEPLAKNELDRIWSALFNIACTQPLSQLMGEVKPESEACLLLGNTLFTSELGAASQRLVYRVKGELKTGFLKLSNRAEGKLSYFVSLKHSSGDSKCLWFDVSCQLCVFSSGSKLRSSFVKGVAVCRGD